MRKPAITVAISTYNWSAALRCAIRSVLLQTVQDIEIIVVGDGCTDDSADVVAAFNDPRLRWHNLERNYGSQWAANNYACEHASADWIAYLGHDDIWYPTHLEAILHAARLEAADVVTSTVILYWPEVTGGHSIAGVFPTGTYTTRDFVPPSAFAHARAMYGEVAQWRNPDTLLLPMDAAFINELALKDRTFAQTRELTCFKFNAAWRRDAYKLKAVDEQLRMLERIETGVDFRQSELLTVLQSVVAGRFHAVGAPRTEGVSPGWFVRNNRRNKGLESRHAELRRVEAATRFDLSTQTMYFEWHENEHNQYHGHFRWTGPSPRATIDLPVVFDRDFRIRIHVIGFMCKDQIERVKLSLHGRPLETSVARTGDTYIVEVLARYTAMDAGRDFGITLDVGAVFRPIDLDINEDTRWLGLAINWIELAPADAPPRAGTSSASVERPSK